MITALLVIVAAGVGGAAAGYVFWWAAHRSGLWSLFAGVVFGLLAVLAAVLIGYLMMKVTYPG